jgi:superoxide dismutase, Fe-Mn family
MFKLAPLPYPYDALAPVISAETMEYHHDKHHRAYVEKLNDLVKDKGLDAASLEELVRHGSGDVFNNASQAWNHEFFWHTVSPQHKYPPQGALAAALQVTYRSLESFKKHFKKLAAAQFGSGWAWLVLAADGTLDTITTTNADTPLCSKQTPLLVCDVWEHAYYLDYRNDRERYLNGFWEIIDWEEIGRRYAEASTAVIPEKTAPSRLAIAGTI